MKKRKKKQEKKKRKRSCYDMIKDKAVIFFIYSLGFYIGFYFEFTFLLLY